MQLHVLEPLLKFSVHMPVKFSTQEKVQTNIIM